jgi:molybdopterin-guanine dinucleotide biosynthesis protein
LIIVEGNPKVAVPKILVARDHENARKKLDPNVICIILKKKSPHASFGVPVFDFSEIGKIADVLEKQLYESVEH